MGIREHLSKKVDEKEMKLSDLSFDMPEKQDESEFDVERDVSERMKSSLLSRLKETRPSGFNVNARINAAWDSFISNASKMKTLFPEEVDGLDFNQEQLEGLKARLIYIGKHRGDTEFLKFAQGLRGVLGNNFDKTELPSRLNKKMIKRLKSDIAKVELDPFQASYSSCVVLMENLVNYKIAWLDQFESLDIGDGLFERLKSDIESWRTNDIVNFCYIASAVRILFPERFDGHMGEAISASLHGQLLLDGGLFYMIFTIFVMGLFYRYLYYLFIKKNFFFFNIIYIWFTINIFGLLRSGVGIFSGFINFLLGMIIVYVFYNLFKTKSKEGK